MKVMVLLGSESDFGTIEAGLGVLKDFGVPFGIEVTSAHRSPERTLALVRTSEAAGVEVFIAVAGKAAHLAGVVAAHTVRPVIGVPVGGEGVAGGGSPVHAERGKAILILSAGRLFSINGRHRIVERYVDPLDGVRSLNYPRQGCPGQQSGPAV